MSAQMLAIRQRGAVYKLHNFTLPFNPPEWCSLGFSKQTAESPRGFVKTSIAGTHSQGP